MTWTKTDQQIKNLLNECVAELGGLSDILSTIGSWKDTLSDEDVLGALQVWLDATQRIKLSQLSIIPTKRRAKFERLDGKVVTTFMPNGGNEQDYPHLIQDCTVKPLGELESNPKWIAFSEKQKYLGDQITKLMAEFEQENDLVDFTILDKKGGKFSVICVIEEDKINELLKTKT